MLMVLALLAAICGGCGGSSSGSGTSGSGKNTILRIGTTYYIDSLNPLLAYEPQASNAFTMIYPQLVQYGPGLKIAPDWATSWEESKDGLTWTFHLKPGGKWSDGVPLTAEDAVWWVNTIFKYQNGATSYLAGELAGLKKIAAPDPNTLVLATPADNPAGITSVHDIGNAKLVVGDPSVPIGAYTLTVLDNLGIKPSSLNIVSQEAKVTDIVTKLELGEADAGFIYTSDAKTAGDKLKSIQLPASAQATATYPIGIVTGSKNAKAAQQWIDLVMSPQGQQVLVGDGFGPAPSS